jgi:hypothetical protein
MVGSPQSAAAEASALTGNVTELAVESPRKRRTRLIKQILGPCADALPERRSDCPRGQPSALGQPLASGSVSWSTAAISGHAQVAVAAGGDQGLSAAVLQRWRCEHDVELMHVFRVRQRYQR